MRSVCDELGEAERKLRRSKRESRHARAQRMEMKNSPSKGAPRPYWPAKTNGTFAMVCPPAAGNCQERTLLAMQLARPV